MNQTSLLKPITALRKSGARLTCVALTHNEGRILPEFLAHYRLLGVDHFLIVDDRSNDGSRELLEAQHDVSLFSPVDGSSYSRDKRFWRAQLLDGYCDCSWVVVPDVDEHLVYHQVEDRDLHTVISGFESEGAEAVQATMIDMYQDAPLSEHRYQEGRLIETFPLFDGPDSYMRIASPRKFRAKYPTPYFQVIGGMRQRIFAPLGVSRDSAEARMIHRFADVGGSYEPGYVERLRAALLRHRLRARLRNVPLYNLTKIPLLRWQSGMYFYNGAHALSRKLPLAKSRMALLHFKFTNGVDQIRYIADRGEHAQGSAHYMHIVEQEALLARSPTFTGTRPYQTSKSLGRLLG
ncbi:glycosyltransferase family 2 protein [Thioclava sp. 15-R06ZXC-3]|uniref:Glycosyltransferase family 2 protein n=1 Tax=Thioclava arctica TaxID=3238301 RepID=A0ABV3TJ20_9RHOB